MFDYVIEPVPCQSTYEVGTVRARRIMRTESLWKQLELILSNYYNVVKTAKSFRAL